MENKSGIYPVEYKVLVKPQPIEETDEVLSKAKSAGIYVPEDNTDREQMMQQRGTVVDHGGNAFRDFIGRRPEVGHAVLFGKYVGSLVTGSDGETYRLMNDRDISAVIGE